ncbi:putative pyruvate decarboxylase C13A11.06 [Trichoderma asperellum]|uniref:Putative pyruvate decarboxylase C13A11.06 n=1 Tax=Trichoderma asperellum TaxID=101201 RepID=A0A6V8R3G6_TRIAP|nr:putative pyruvate decarboxylase C13A11.06 [Trichoderma asperellum]
MAEIPIGEYLFRRLKQMGIETAFGVPGEPAGVRWIGTPNELVGAYAADGYARLKGAAALVTTFGPGELSALCGIGGAFCEMVPVLHIVGYPSFAAQSSGRILHHTLGDKSYE